MNMPQHGIILATLSGSSCPGCGLANYDGLCPHCRGDQDAYERELVPPFPSSIEREEDE
jgi:hypothetical protein